MVVDTSIFIEYVRSTDKTATILGRLPVGSLLYVSAVTVYEIMAATDPIKRRDFRLLFEDLLVLPFTTEVAEKSAEIYQNLKTQGQTIEHNDIFIAATALVNNLPVKTLKVRHFSRVKGLALL
ncbi:MAG: hypothetical protein EPGJADBJ_05335 [Saprospiraceae bacterium]|nr:hypothetical protein [Saprospiraceae bacterium]